MSDLISRKKISGYIKMVINPYGKPFKGTVYELGLKIMRYIDSMNSAYSVDKVVEELEEFLINYGVSEKSNVHQRIIEIVKQGGVSEDMCECRQLEDYNSLFKTSCGHIYRMGNNFKFCPHCGKKIKIVGD